MNIRDERANMVAAEEGILPCSRLVGIDESRKDMLSLFIRDVYPELNSLYTFSQGVRRDAATLFIQPLEVPKEVNAATSDLTLDILLQEGRFSSVA